MAVQRFSGFTSFIKIKLADTDIPFISSWRVAQTRASSMLVYTISNSPTASGAAQQQIAWNMQIDIPISVLEEFALDINDLAIGDGTQIICTLNRPTSNNENLGFSGKTLVFSDLSPETNSFDLREGSVTTQTASFFAGKLNTSGS